MTRSLITSVNGQWRDLPVMCACGHQFTLELGQDVKIKVAPPRSLNHTWYAQCPRCRRDAVVVWPAGGPRIGVNQLTTRDCV